MTEALLGALTFGAGFFLGHLWGEYKSMDSIASLARCFRERERALKANADHWQAEARRMTERLLLIRIPGAPDVPHVDGDEPLQRWTMQESEEMEAARQQMREEMRQQQHDTDALTRMREYGSIE